MNLFVELFRFIVKRKRFWLMPVILIMAGLGALIAFGEASAIAPLIYTIF
jgi:hypothetical protein